MRDLLARGPPSLRPAVPVSAERENVASERSRHPDSSGCMSAMATKRSFDSLGMNGAAHRRNHIATALLVANTRCAATPASRPALVLAHAFGPTTSWLLVSESGHAQRPFQRSDHCSSAPTPAVWSTAPTLLLFCLQAHESRLTAGVTGRAPRSSLDNGVRVDGSVASSVDCLAVERVECRAAACVSAAEWPARLVRPGRTLTAVAGRRHRSDFWRR
jgi:hypothetical protein